MWDEGADVSDPMVSMLYSLAPDIKAPNTISSIMNGWGTAQDPAEDDPAPTEEDPVNETSPGDLVWMSLQFA